MTTPSDLVRAAPGNATGKPAAHDAGAPAAKPSLRLKDVLSNGRVAAALTLGFASGLPFSLPQGTLQAWLATLDIDLKTIGWFTVLTVPYTFKFLWAPLLDRFVPPFLGRRRGWILIFQMLLAVVIAAMGLQAPNDTIYIVAVLAFLMSFLSASQDIVIDAYRTDTLRAEERGIGSTATQLGWRIATLIAGALALVMSDAIGWRNTYLAMAALMSATAIFTFLAPEPEHRVVPPRSLAEAVVGPLRELLQRPGALALLALVVLYKVGDAFALTLSTAFLIKGVGFSAAEVGAVAKTTNITATIFGTIFGGLLFAKYGLYRSLMAFGILQAVTNLLYALLANIGHSMPAMVLAVGFDNFAGGMGAAAFGAFLMALCDARFSAFQFALLASLAAIARTFLGPLAGALVEGTRFTGTLFGTPLLSIEFPALGWAKFFVVTFFSALPGLLLLWWLRERVRALDRAP
jgi:MFS transporter, PAT family, beta-lactamase induction signal transducer AmpG